MGMPVSTMTMAHSQSMSYPQHQYAAQPLPTGAMSIPIPGAQNPPTEGHTYASLPKSLQEAFLILDNLTPTPGSGDGQPDAEMIDPALMPTHGLDRAHLPPLPPMPASTLSSTRQTHASSPLTSLASAASGHEPSGHNSQLQGGTASPHQQQHGFAAPQQHHQNFPQPFYYQPAPGTHFLQSETAALSLPGHFRLSTPSFP